MENIKKTLETLNDLVKINNDRIEGFERALKELKGEDSELKYLFTNCVGESHQFKMELGTEIQALGKDIENTTTTSGTLHRTWLDIKSTFTGHSKEDILEECEFGEDAIKKAYKQAVEEEHLPAYIREILEREQQILNAAHDKIKALRDQAKHV